MAVIVGVSCVMMFGLAALVVDLGLARDTAWRAQNSADASALAAANALYTVGKTPHFTDAVDAAREYAQQNYGVADAEWDSCTDANHLAVTAPGTACISFDSSTEPKEVRVVMPPRTVEAGFGQVIGGDDVTLWRGAQARVAPNTKVHCTLCILGAGPHDLQNGKATASGGDIHFNGSVSVAPNGLVSTGGKITVQGTASGGTAPYEPDPITGVPPEPDPLADFVQPASSGTVKSNPCGPMGGPGVYGDFDGIDPGTSCVLEPGLYVITGQWSFSGNRGFVGDAVTLFFTCGSTTLPRACNAPGEGGARLDASGNGTVRVTAPTSGPTKGIAILYDRYNNRDLRYTGNGAMNVTGTIYAPRATLDNRGNGCSSTFQSLVVVGSLRFSGTGSCLNANYDGNVNIDRPPSDLHLTK